MLYCVVYGWLFMLLVVCLLYLVYDYCGFMVMSVGEEWCFNLCFGGDFSEDDFVGYMCNFGFVYLC